jgi:hypothetical protein
MKRALGSMAMEALVYSRNRAVIPHGRALEVTPAAPRAAYIGGP